MVIIADLGLGNIGSVQNMLKKVGVKSELTSDPEHVEAAEKIILPGVGAFDRAVRRMDELGLREVLRQKALEDKVPFLGICLGMQLLMESSEEGRLPGLGLIEGHVQRIEGQHFGLKVPHMGWNVIQASRAHPLLEGLMDEPDLRFYFVHSYWAVPAREEDVLCRTPYGRDFASGVTHGAVSGVQFHPEKSHRYGMKLLRNFAAL